MNGPFSPPNCSPSSNASAAFVVSADAPTIFASWQARARCRIGTDPKRIARGRLSSPLGSSRSLSVLGSLTSEAETQCRTRRCRTRRPDPLSDHQQALRRSSRSCADQTSLHHGTLRSLSFARPGKLFTASAELIVRQIGTLVAERHDRIVEAAVDLLYEGTEADCVGHRSAAHALRCSARSRSLIVLTGANVASGTSTNTVFQRAIDPFQRPGRSIERSGRPSCDFSTIRYAFSST